MRSAQRISMLLAVNTDIYEKGLPSDKSSTLNWPKFISEQKSTKRLLKNAQSAFKISQGELTFLLKYLEANDYSPELIQTLAF